MVAVHSLSCSRLDNPWILVLHSEKGERGRQGQITTIKTKKWDTWNNKRYTFLFSEVERATTTTTMVMNGKNKKPSSGYAYQNANSNSSGYTSIYVPGKVMSPGLWSPGQPSPGEACTHCTLTGCQDDPCELELAVHLCKFINVKPLLQLRGLCKRSLIGN